MEQPIDKGQPTGSLGHAARWSIAARIIAKTCDLLALIILARILVPADFGLVAIAASVVVILESTLDAPLGTVLLRPGANRPEVLNTAFTLAALKGLILAVLLAVAALPLSKLYSEPRLFSVLLALSVAPALRSLASPRLVLFTRAMNFRPEFICEVSGKSVALLIGLAIAFVWGNYWALVGISLTAPAVFCLVSYLQAPYRPVLSLAAWADFSRTVRFGSAVAGMSALSWQLDRLILGRFLSLSALGNYSNAANLAGLPVQVILQPYMRAASARLISQAEDERRRLVYLENLSWGIWLVAPMLLAIAIAARPIIYTLLGTDNWDIAIGVLAVLPLIGIADLVSASLPPVATALDQYRLVVYRGVLELALKAILLMALAASFGVAGALYALLLVAVFSLAYTGFAVRRLLGISLTTQLLNVLRCAVGLVVAYFSMSALLGSLYRAPLDTTHSGVLSKLAQFLEGGVTILSIAVGVYIMTGTVALILWRMAGRPTGVESTIVRKFQRVWDRVWRKLIP